MGRSGSATETVRIEGYEYTLDGHHGRVATQEVSPGGYTNPDAYVRPHTEEGKRRAGWRIEWLVLTLLPLLIVACCLAAGLALAAY